MIDDRLAISVTHSDGSQDRWGPDEPDGHDVPDDLTFTTSVPGGFKDMSCSLSRDLNVYPDENLLDDVLVYGPGGDHAWNGRMVHLPRSYDTSYSLKPSAVGWVSHLTDDGSARDIWVDIDMSKWSGPTAKRVAQGAATNSWDEEGPIQAPGALLLQFTGPWPRANGIASEAWYDSGAIGLGSIYGACYAVEPQVVGGNWVWYLFLSDDDTDIGSDHSANLANVSPNSATLTSSAATGRRWAQVQLYYPNPGGTVGQNYTLGWTCLAVYGTHGLTKYGTEDAYNAKGFLISDIVANIVGRWAPLLNFTSPGSIEPSTFVCPQFAQYTMTTAEDLLTQANAFELNDWGVYSGGEEGWPLRTFFYRNPSPDRLTWRARRSDGATLTNEGIQAENLVNGVVVNFTSADGTTHTAGPIGSTAEFTDGSLTDSDPNNPVNMHKIPNKTGILTMSKKTTTAGAIQTGALWLARRVGVQRRGTMNLTGKIRHPSGVYYPAWRARSGDYVILEDDPRDTEPREIINTTYTHKTRTIACDLQHDAFRIDAMMEQMGVEVAGIT